MVSKKILKEIEKMNEVDCRTRGDLLPEEKKFFKKMHPGMGYHIHDEDNPFGMHRHLVEDDVDGAHTHTPQNPMGEHVHGEFEGMALIDGAHTHDGEWDSGHWHNNDGV